MRLFSLLLVLCLSLSTAFAAQSGFRGFTALPKPLGVSAIPFSDPGGNTVTIGAWQGQWLLLNVWATWCAPCVAELPTLQGLGLSNPRLQVIAVSFDTGKTTNDINAFLAKRNIGPFAGYMDSTRALQTALRSSGIPMSYLINPQGQIVARYRGAANWADPLVAQDVNRWMSAGAASSASLP